MKVQVVGAIIENGEGRVLLAQRPEGKPLAGFWEFPGGKIEVGESPDAALRRELKEELDLDIRLKSDLGQFDHEYPWGFISLHIFVVEAVTEPRPSVDVKVFRWVLRDEVESFALSPADIEPWSCYLATSPKTETV